MLSSREDIQHRRFGQNVTIDRRNFEVVKDFVYLGSAVNAENNTSAEINRRITLANRFGKVLSRGTKVLLYKTLIRRSMDYDKSG